MPEIENLSAKQMMYALLTELYDSCIHVKSAKNVTKLMDRIKGISKANHISFDEIGFESKDDFEKFFRRIQVFAYLKEFRARKAKLEPGLKSLAKLIMRYTCFIGKTLPQMGTSCEELNVTDEDLERRIIRYEKGLVSPGNKHENNLAKIQLLVDFLKKLRTESNG